MPPLFTPEKKIPLLPPLKPLTHSSAVHEWKAASAYREAGQLGPRARMGARLKARDQASRQRWRRQRQQLIHFWCLFECAPRCTLVQQRNQPASAKLENASQGGSLRRMAQLRVAPAASTARGNVIMAANSSPLNPANNTHINRNRKQRCKNEQAAPSAQATRTPAQLLYNGSAGRTSQLPRPHGPAQPRHVDTSQMKPKGTTADHRARRGGGVSGVHVTQAVHTPAVLHWPDFSNKTSAQRARAHMTLR
jgi:hypothetical protein